MRILAIETSCDDTSMAFIEANLAEGGELTGIPEFKVIKNIVSSQTDIHRHLGGVVPNLAKREHIRTLPIIWQQIQPDLKPDLLAVTVGPGLEPALWTGIEFAKKISAELKIPLVGVNHLEGHLYSFLLPSHVSFPRPSEKDPPKEDRRESSSSLTIRNGSQIKFGMTNGSIEFPAIALLVSGGHTMLLLMSDLRHWKKLGETRDDAVGEAFDKVARMLALPYPGGPEIEKLAREGNPAAIQFPRPMIHEKNYDFSFSGLKTSVLYHLRDKKNEAAPDVAASFQAAAVNVLTAKTTRAAKEFGAKSIILCGGVAANKALRGALEGAAQTLGIKFLAPDFEYNTDNAGMIAAAAYMRRLRRARRLPLEANGNLSL